MAEGGDGVTPLDEAQRLAVEALIAERLAAQQAIYEAQMFAGRNEVERLQREAAEQQQA